MEVGQAVGDRDEDRDEIVGRHPAAAGPSDRQASRRGHSSMTKNGSRPVAGSPGSTSKTATTPGWDAAASDRASRSKRAAVAGSSGEVRQEDLDRDVPIEPFVAGSMDGRHAAGPERSRIR